VSAVSDQIARLARRLPAADRARLVDELLASLDEPDQAIDAAWLEECRRRLAALDTGEMGWVELEQVLAELRDR